jgi:hypothetical protein
MDEPRMAALLVEHRRPGFYFRVLEAGEVAAGDEIAKVSDGPERMSVAEADALLYLTGHSRDQLERALRIPALPAGWRGSFQARCNTDLMKGKQRETTSERGGPRLMTDIHYRLLQSRIVSTLGAPCRLNTTKITNTSSSRTVSEP